MLPSPSVARIQGESGYVRIQPGTHSGEGFASSQACSFLPGGQAGCVDVVHVVQTSSTQLPGGSNSVITSLVPSTSTLSAGEATLVAVATLEATITATSTTSPTNEALPGLADESGSKNNIVGPAVGGSLGGLALILLILAVYWFCKRRKRQHSTRSQTGSRGLIGGGLRGGNNGGHTVLDGGESEYKYHYRTSRMAVASPKKTLCQSTLPRRRTRTATTKPIMRHPRLIHLRTLILEVSQLRLFPSGLPILLRLLSQPYQ
ncbi:hypothetical protein AAF712_011347 [Marasmius tenuissimus]|uniref:Uncharacterized protein n=1 Tax=Marasmius tenuissimus TaxID=585030 RepID=A0ABR2ZLI9_9AGAR